MVRGIEQAHQRVNLDREEREWQHSGVSDGGRREVQVILITQLFQTCTNAATTTHTTELVEPERGAATINTVTGAHSEDGHDGYRNHT